MTKAFMILALSLAATPAFAAGEHGGSHADTASAEVDRTIEFNAGDMWFDPESLQIKPGETIRFVVTNTGNLEHEFVIGDTAAQREHREMMQSMMTQGHGDGGHGGHGGHDMAEGAHGGSMPSVTLKPGEAQTLVWTAPDNVDALEYACNIPGHYEAGMYGSIRLEG